MTIFRFVHPELVQALAAQRSQIVARWETYLRMQPVVSALARPDTLMFGVDGVLDEVFARLRRPPAKRPVRRWADNFCSRNPLRAFYASGEQALLEIMVIAHTSLGCSLPRQRTAALEEVRQAIRVVARRDLEGLASLCRTCRANITGAGRCPAEGCRAGWAMRSAERDSRSAPCQWPNIPRKCGHSHPERIHQRPGCGFNHCPPDQGSSTTPLKTGITDSKNAASTRPTSF